MGLRHRPINYVAVKRICRGLVFWAAILAAVFAFVFLSGHGQIDEFLKKITPPRIDTPVFIAPCVIFGLTVTAYYHFITSYRGTIAGLSLTFLLIALVCCIGLVLYQDWWMHLRFLYFLFASYICWDILMIELMLKPSHQSAKLSPNHQHDLLEIDLVSSYINIPTLITIFCVSFYCSCFLSKGNATKQQVEHFVEGVVSFHLLFSSLAYFLGTRHLRSVFKKHPKLTSGSADSLGSSETGKVSSPAVSTDGNEAYMI
jgi:hypothetical protein